MEKTTRPRWSSTLTILLVILIRVFVLTAAVARKGAHKPSRVPKLWALCMVKEGHTKRESERETERERGRERDTRREWQGDKKRVAGRHEESGRERKIRERQRERERADQGEWEGVCTCVRT